MILGAIIVIAGLTILIISTVNRRNDGKLGIKTPAAIAGPAGIYAVYVINDPGEFEIGEVGRLLDNPAVSGIALRLRWEYLEPAEGKYDLSIINQTLAEAKQRQKNISLIIVPGFYTPKWLINQLVDCEEKSTRECGKAMFTVDYGAGRGDRLSLPLPWNETYLGGWKKFLGEIAGRYNSQSAIVSIAVAGPTSMSAEMSLPGDSPADLEKWRRILEIFYPAGDPHRESNLVIIEKWQEMIDFYEQTFSGKSIVVTRGSGLLKFGPRNPQESKEIIINYFIKANYPRNQKANQTSGLKACRENEGGIEGVKQTIRQGLIGGAQFNSSVVKNPTTMGCADGLTPEQALKDVLRVYFNNTTSGSRWGGQNGEAALKYLQLYAADIDYANDHPEFQAILNQVSRDLTD